MTGPVVAVVGGGPAGLIAAETLGNAGVSVTMYEARRSVGRKFQLAGRGGLNLTHSEPLDTLLERYGPQRDRLDAALRAFGPDELRQWAQSLDEETFVGTSGRVFPKSFRATPLLRAWLRRLDRLGVRLETGYQWSGFDDPATAEADAVVLALGGASWPRVGSDGSWAAVVKEAGIAVSPLRAANCGLLVDWSPQVRDRFSGSPLKNVAFTVEGDCVRGDAMITAGGLEGGPIYAHSRAVREQLATTGTAIVHVDLHPDLTVAALAGRLSKRRPKATVTSWLTAAGFTPAEIGVMRDCTANALPVEARLLAELAKALPIRVTGTSPIERAISTAGGIAFDEIDSRFMLRARPGWFVAGEMLDWEAPTGGYLLQACFSTGVAAARGALSHIGAE